MESSPMERRVPILRLHVQLDLMRQEKVDGIPLLIPCRQMHRCVSMVPSKIDISAFAYQVTDLEKCASTLKEKVIQGRFHPGMVTNSFCAIYQDVHDINLRFHSMVYYRFITDEICFSVNQPFHCQRSAPPHSIPYGIPAK